MAELWEKSYPPGFDWHAEIKTALLTDEQREAARRWGTKSFIEFGPITLDFVTFDALVERAARGFAALGVKPGVHVALHLPNTPHYPLAFYGVLRAGGVVANLSPLDAERELAHKIALADVSLVVSFAGLDQKLPPPGPNLRIMVATPEDMAPVPPPAIPTDPAERIPFRVLLDPTRPSPGPWPTPAVDDLAVLQFTGGTTGLPKAAMLSHANLTASVSSYDAWGSAPSIGLTPGAEKVLVVLPLFHIYALNTLLLRGMRNGYTLLLKARWDTDDILDTIARDRPTMFSGVPTMFRAIASHPRARQVDFSCFHFCNTGGAPLPMELRDEFEGVADRLLLEGWGMSETSPAGTVTPPQNRKLGSAGLPLPGVTIEIRDLDEPERKLAPNEKGEICIRGKNVTKGYYKQPEETANAFVDGFFRTGDIGYLDDDGFLFIVDRKKDMILSGGFNVYPRLIEEAIYEHPAVAEVIVIGVPDAYRGESAKAFVTLRDGAAAPSLDDLRAFLADKVGKHELPAALEIRDSLPKTAVGKLWKKPLVDEARAQAKVR
ncbi:dicarboxylate--CoA ligase PimA [Aliidongia dinghuensis]|uniref:Long-chain-fatty-acid--CoA ligase n=1 Tax=Aliidongia dinghuensis TaxID=1867774 RepID=A0A8J3E1I5_9PROT|nr:AMP-binding protein [Aliidongia dinghuensis]GGF02379.1 dicarboxylate--CoA ligase PimA [Aliidongia dinghuensis]